MGGCWPGSVAAHWPYGAKPAGVPAHHCWVGRSSLRGQQAKSDKGTQNLSFKLSSEDTNTQISFSDSSL